MLINILVVNVLLDSFRIVGIRYDCVLQNHELPTAKTKPWGRKQRGFVLDLNELKCLELEINVSVSIIHVT